MAETLQAEKMAVPEIAMEVAPAAPVSAQPEAPANIPSQASQALPTPSATSEEVSAAAIPPVAETPSQPEAVEQKAESKPEVKAETKPDEKTEDKPAGEHKASLLSEAGKKEKAEKAAKEEKAAKGKEEAKPEAKIEAKEEPLPPIEYKPFRTPKDLPADEQALGKYTEVLGKHRASQELGQELVDMYFSEAKLAAARMQKHQWDVWSGKQEEWISKAQSDPEFGGNRMATSLRRAASIIEQYGGNHEQIKELRDAMTYTGFGNHPAAIRLLNNVGKALGEGKPVPAPTPQHAPQPKPGRAARLYNGS
jgi:hypothetical protein